MKKRAEASIRLHIECWEDNEMLIHSQIKARNVFWLCC